MRNSWIFGIFIAGVVITVLIAFNYQGSKNTVPLSEIFPEEETLPVKVDYEFVDSETTKEISTVDAVKEIKEAPIETAKQVIDATKEEVPFTIQIASFKNKESAQTSLSKALDKGYAGFIVSKDLGDQGTWHRVYVGVFQTKPQAEEELSKVQQDYPGSFVIIPK